MIKLIDDKIIDATTLLAKENPRLRMNHNFHELPDPLQRMLNAVQPGSYIRPHRHFTPPKVEVFIILKGRGAAILFNDDGSIKEIVVMDAGGPVRGVEFAPGSWHTIVSLKEGTVFFEAKDGPYIAISDKDFAPWAPEPSDTAGARSYLSELTRFTRNR